jgi:hypothetical protein
MALPYVRRTGWSMVGAPAPRVTSMTFVAPATMYASSIGALASLHGLRPTGSWVAKPPQPVTIPL